MVKIYKQPFAHDGDAIAIPDVSQPDGKMSNTDGWTPDYQLKKTDPNYKPVGRQEMNGVFKEVTEALGQMQVQGAASWSADGAPYPINAQVYHNGKQWLALRANSVEPADSEDWSELVARSVIVVNSVSEMIELTGIKVGSTVRTLGYYTSGDGGGSDYEIVAAGTGADDGGSFIDLSGSGLQARGFFDSKVSVTQFGAVNDGLTESHEQIQSAVNFWRAKDYWELLFPSGTYYIASKVDIDQNKAKYQKIIMDGDIVTPDDLPVAFEIYDSTSCEYYLKVGTGGRYADYDVAEPIDGTTAFILRGTSRARIEVKAISYSGRVLRIPRQKPGENKTGILDIKMNTGRLSLSHSRCGQSIFADDELADSQGGWGVFRGELYYDRYGPIFQDLNDVFIEYIDGAFWFDGVQLRGCRACFFGDIYIGDTWKQAGDNTSSTDGTALMCIPSPASGRSCAAISGNQLRGIKSKTVLYCESFDSSSQGIYIDTVRVNRTNESAIVLNDMWSCTINNIRVSNAPTALELISTRRSSFGIWSRGFTSDGVIIDAGCSDNVITGDIRDGATGFSLISYSGTFPLTLRDLTLSSANVDQLIDITSAATTNLKHLGGRVVASAGAQVYRPGRRPRIIRDVTGHPTRNNGTSTMTSGTSSLVVNHGLSRTPNEVTAIGSGQDTSQIWITDIGNTSFTVNVPADVSGDQYIKWTASAEVI